MYSIGVDYGTLSGRVVLLDISSGREVGLAVIPYAHGVIDDKLPETAEKLPAEWALQHPQDYLDVINRGIPEVLRQSGVSGQQVIGLGIDFTSCTVLPVTEDGEPLCFMEPWRVRKHAWPKLWKHHAAQPIADRMNAAAEARGDTFLARYGGRISSEWYFPKLIEIFEEDREVYDACYAFVEATDWVIWYLTGRLARNSCTAGYKALWSDVEGLPSDAYFTAVNSEFTQPAEKLGQLFYPLGTCAGVIRQELAQELGLAGDVAVAVGNVDAMVSVPAVGVSDEGTLIMVMGTSICHLAVSEREVLLPGITGVVKDGVLEGLYGYEAGQAAVGDMYEWFVEEQVPTEYVEEAKRRNTNIFAVLEEAAAKLAPGENGLIALDWWNGNRSILADANLSGLIVGLTLSTQTPAIYRALLEATAMGTRRIIDNFREHGVELRELVACGGLAQKSPLLMQIYADVCGLPVTVRVSSEIPARGAALYGAVAAGGSGGGFDTIAAAAVAMAPALHSRYMPNATAVKVYEEIYRIYRDVYEWFGTTHWEYMHQLKDIRKVALGEHQ